MESLKIILIVLAGIHMILAAIPFESDTGILGSEKTDIILKCSHGLEADKVKGIRITGPKGLLFIKSTDSETVGPAYTSIVSDYETIAANDYTLKLSADPCDSGTYDCSVTDTDGANQEGTFNLPSVYMMVDDQPFDEDVEKSGTGKVKCVALWEKEGVTVDLMKDGQSAVSEAATEDSTCSDGTSFKAEVEVDYDVADGEAQFKCTVDNVDFATSTEEYSIVPPGTLPTTTADVFQSGASAVNIPFLCLLVLIFMHLAIL